MKVKSTELRKTLVIVNELINAGINFIPMPILNKKDEAILIKDSIERLEKLRIELESEDDT